MITRLCNLNQQNVTTPQGKVTRKVTLKNRYILTQLYYYIMKCNFVTLKNKGIYVRADTHVRVRTYARVNICVPLYFTVTWLQR